MGGQHKKNVRAEKAKVKLKGAKLPKGLNVTKTDFKVRKIEIREQLKESVLNAVGQRQLNLKETLSRLKHHSVKFRTDALRSVRDCVKLGQADHLIGHLNELLQGIASAAIDMERDARHESFKTLDALLEALQPLAVSPFFHILATYLRCAMTHVLPSIQEDALLMLDVLLQRVPPQLLAERSAHTIIGNFIDMISRARHDSARSNRTLTVRLGHGQQQQTTTVKWRTKVLQRLQQVLNTLVQQRPVAGAAGAVFTSSFTVHFDAETPQFYGLLRPLKLSTLEFTEMLGNERSNARSNESAQLRSYVEQLQPLLQDNWLEVRPTTSATTTTTAIVTTTSTMAATQKLLLTTDAAESLHALLDIMTQLWTLVRQHEAAHNTHELSDWMRASYAAAFVRNFLDGDTFPYQQMPLSQAGKKAAKAKRCSAAPLDLDGHCTPQNLALVLLMCHFFPQPSASQAAIYRRLLQYLLVCVQRLDTTTLIAPEQQLRLVAALRALLLDNGAALLQLQPAETRELLRASMEAYVQQRYTTREGVATRVLHLLCHIVQNAKLYAAYGGDSHFNAFLSYLPQLLLKPTIGDATLRAMTTLCRQLNGGFMMALMRQSQAILGNIGQLQVTGASANDGFESQKRVLNLFYYARDSGEQTAALKDAMQQLELEPRTVSYLRCLLAHP